jgi:adenylate kinase family enzyme
MRKVAVFGNTGGGKSTLARQMAEVTQLPLYPLDVVQYQKGGGKIPHEDYLKAHGEILARPEWIIDGYGCPSSSWERFAKADTLVYIDFPRWIHYAWVTKRFLKGFFVNPEGWPENSPMWSSTLEGYRVVGLCHRHLTPKYRQLVADATSTKRVHHLRSPSEVRRFLETIRQEYVSFAHP